MTALRCWYLAKELPVGGSGRGAERRVSATPAFPLPLKGKLAQTKAHSHSRASSTTAPGLSYSVSPPALTRTLAPTGLRLLDSLFRGSEREPLNPPSVF